MTTPITIESANATRARIAEIDSILETKGPRVDDLKAEADRLELQAMAVQRELDSEKDRAAHKIRREPMTANEKEHNTTRLKELTGQLKSARRAYDSARTELDNLEAERTDLINNPPVPTLEDVKAAYSQFMALVQVSEQLQQAADKAANKPPAADTDAMAAAVETLLAERDLMAVDVDLGARPEAELKKLNARLTKAQRELADALETADIGQATQRGYQRRLAAAEADRADAENGYRALLSFFARNEHREEVERLQALTDDLDRSLCRMAGYSELSARHGDGREFLSPGAGIRIEAQGINGMTTRNIKPDSDAARNAARELLDRIAQP